MAVDWIRKGGDLAVEVTRQLNLNGLPTELTVLGCQPPGGETKPFVRWAGFVSKSTVEGRERISSLLRQSHFSLLPSIADCTPIVFNEANAWGVPCLSTRVGGIPSVIRDDINGRLFDLNAQPESYTDYIRSVMATSDRYRQLALSSLNEYKVRLNWDTSGQKLKELLEAIPNAGDLRP
jgi:glycosyltransferase involved in cell wall biosynthesis